jgi:hypothetical protein
MLRRALALLGLVPSLWGCTVSAVTQQGDPSPSNACKTDSDCGADICRAGVCNAANGMLEALLISATPPSDSPVPHMTYVAQVDDVPAQNDQDLVLPGPSHLVGSFVLPTGETCYPTFVSDDPKNPYFVAEDGRALPATVTLALSERLLGLPQQLSFAATGIRNLQGTYQFDVQVPRGEYDIYLVPPKNQQKCPVPPQLFRRFALDKENLEVAFSLSAISQLPLSIRWPKSSPSLAGWTVDLIEPLAGNPISTELVLAEPPEVGGNSSTIEYTGKLSFSTVALPPDPVDRPVEPEGTSDLLRFRPPADVVAPTILMARSGLGLLGGTKDVVAIDHFTRLPSSVQVEGQLARVDDGRPVPGFVTLISTKIYGVDGGIFASYQTTVEIGADGALHVAVPPGSYKVQAVPPAPGLGNEAALAALETNWDIPADVPVQYGKLLELSPITSVVGQSEFLGAQVQAIPSPKTKLPFEVAFAEGRPFTPRAGIGLVDDAGRFAVAADPGVFDVSVQPPESLGFGWFVHTGVSVGAEDENLGLVTPPKPVVLSGTGRVALLGAEVPLGSAAIRAYAYLDKNLAYTRDARQAVSVVQVADTRADENGAFNLLIPSSIVAPK